MKVYVIISGSYDGGEWNEWQREGLVFSTREKADKWIEDKNLSNSETEELELI